jgi:hypothetical protein
MYTQTNNSGAFERIRPLTFANGTILVITLSRRIPRIAARMTGNSPDGDFAPKDSPLSHFHAQKRL